jgi:transcriptional regulator with XRE-family HTH domain
MTSEGIETPRGPRHLRFMQTNPSAGPLVRAWRERRRLSQFALAHEAEVSQRHLSFIESGRAKPSREMVLRLAEHLDVPLRDRNLLLMQAGYAPVYPERPLDDPALVKARAAVQQVLAGHEPYPALAVDRGWNVVAANAAIGRLLAPVDPELMKPPMNAMRVTLHPRGMAPLIANLGQWRAHLIERLRRQAHLAPDARIEALLAEVSLYPAAAAPRPDLGEEIAAPLRLRTQRGLLSMLSTITVFGTALDITLAELSIECFYPADAATAEALREMAAGK